MTMLIGMFVGSVLIATGTAIYVSGALAVLITAEGDSKIKPIVAALFWPLFAIYFMLSQKGSD